MRVFEILGAQLRRVRIVRDGSRMKWRYFFQNRRNLLQWTRRSEKLRRMRSETLANAEDSAAVSADVREREACNSSHTTNADGLRSMLCKDRSDCSRVQRFNVF